MEKSDKPSLDFGIPKSFLGSGERKHLIVLAVLGLGLLALFVLTPGLVKPFNSARRQQEVLEERSKLPDDPRWTEYIAQAEKEEESPLKQPGRVERLEDRR